MAFVYREIFKKEQLFPDDESKNPCPVFTFFTPEKDEIDKFIGQQLNEEIGQKHPREDADHLAGRVEHKGLASIAGDI